MVGEKHGIKENFEYYLKLIKRFNRKEKITVFFETSYSAGVYINEYINGNEIFPLKEFVNDYKGTMLGSYELERFIISLKKYNNKCKNKIQFVGIDLEFQNKTIQKMLEYSRINNLKDVHETIVENDNNTKAIKKLNDKEYEVKREEYLVYNFNNLYASAKNKKGLCFMGAWHIRDYSEDLNFIKEIRKYISNILSVEILYKNSMRTIKDSTGFNVISIDDDFERNKYIIYGNIGINKTNPFEGILILENCEELEII